MAGAGGKSGEGGGKAKATKRPYNIYNLYFIIERELFLQERGVFPPPAALRATPSSDDYSGVELPPLPPRYVSLVLPGNWYVPGTRGRRRLHVKTHGLMSFKEMAQTIASRWKEEDEDIKAFFQEVADKLLARHNYIKAARARGLELAAIECAPRRRGEPEAHVGLWGEPSQPFMSEAKAGHCADWGGQSAETRTAIPGQSFHSELMRNHNKILRLQGETNQLNRPVAVDNVQHGRVGRCLPKSNRVPPEEKRPEDPGGTEWEGEVPLETMMSCLHKSLGVTSQNCDDDLNEHLSDRPSNREDGGKPQQSGAVVPLKESTQEPMEGEWMSDMEKECVTECKKEKKDQPSALDQEEATKQEPDLPVATAKIERSTEEEEANQLAKEHTTEDQLERERLALQGAGEAELKRLDEEIFEQERILAEHRRKRDEVAHRLRASQAESPRLYRERSTPDEAKSAELVEKPEEDVEEEKQFLAKHRTKKDGMTLRLTVNQLEAARLKQHRVVAEETKMAHLEKLQKRLSVQKQEIIEERKKREEKISQLAAYKVKGKQLEREWLTTEAEKRAELESVERGILELKRNLAEQETKKDEMTRQLAAGWANSVLMSQKQLEVETAKQVELETLDRGILEKERLWDDQHEKMEDEARRLVADWAKAARLGQDQISVRSSKRAEVGNPESSLLSQERMSVDRRKKRQAHGLTEDRGDAARPDQVHSAAESAKSAELERLEEIITVQERVLAESRKKRREEARRLAEGRLFGQYCMSCAAD